MKASAFPGILGKSGSDLHLAGGNLSYSFRSVSGEQLARQAMQLGAPPGQRFQHG